MFRDTFAIPSWEAEACDPGLWSEAPHSTYCNCLRSNDAQWLQQWRPPQSFQMQCVCDEFTRVIGIYWLLSAVFLTLVCVTTVPYHILSSSERIAICTVASVSAVYRCAGVSFQPYHRHDNMPVFFISTPYHSHIRLSYTVLNLGSKKAFKGYAMLYVMCYNDACYNITLGWCKKDITPVR